MSDYRVRMQGETTDDDELTIDMGAIAGAWWDVPLPACPDCGGDVVWYEAGFGPGTRKCMGQPVAVVDDAAYPDGKRRTYDEANSCGSMFSVQTDAGRASLRRERFYI